MYKMLMGVGLMVVVGCSSDARNDGPGDDEGSTPESDCVVFCYPMKLHDSRQEQQIDALATVELSTYQVYCGDSRTGDSTSYPTACASCVPVDDQDRVVTTWAESDGYPRGYQLESGEWVKSIISEQFCSYVGQ